MKEIKSILNVLEMPNIEREPLLGDVLSDGDSLIQKLARNISGNAYSSDRDAATDLYGPLYKKHNFEALKSKVKHRALATLLVTELKNEHRNSREAMQHRLHKMLVQVNLLLAFGERPAGIKLLEKLSVYADEYSFTELQLIATRLLRSHSWFVGDATSYRRQTRKLQKLSNIIEREFLGEEIYQTATQPFVTSKAKQHRLTQTFKVSLSTYRRLRSTADSYTLTVNWYKLHVAALEHNNEYTQVAKECDSAIEYVKSQKYFYSKKLLVHFLLSKCEALLLMQKNAEVLKLVPGLRDLIPRHNPNRIIVERYAFLAHLRSFHFEEASQILEQIGPSLESTVLEQRKEEWALLRAYLNLIRHLAEGRKGNTGAFNFSPEALKHLSKDKLGNNIAVLVLEAVCAIVSRHFDTLNMIDKKIDNYLYRHLHTSKEYRRTAAFLKLLRILIKEDYNKEKIAAKTRRYATVLNNTEMLPEPTEILFYEKLWELLFASL